VRVRSPVDQQLPIRSDTRLPEVRIQDGRCGHARHCFHLDAIAGDIGVAALRDMVGRFPLVLPTARGRSIPDRGCSMDHWCARVVRRPQVMAVDEARKYVPVSKDLMVSSFAIVSGISPRGDGGDDG
jgi:hypothetical protein